MTLHELTDGDLAQMADVELARMAQETGSEAAQCELCNRYTPLLYGTVASLKKTWTLTVDEEWQDLEGYLWIVLLEAIQEYNVDGSVPFAGFLNSKIKCVRLNRLLCRNVIVSRFKAILTDIEGTTSAVSFVFDVLFPYAAAHLPDFVRGHAGEPGVAVTEQGYYSPSTNIKNVMDPDKYAFWYEGQPWKGAAERGINPGDLRDGGSLEQRAANVAYWHQWPDEYDHLIQRWDEFLNA